MLQPLSNQDPTATLIVASPVSRRPLPATTARVSNFADPTIHRAAGVLHMMRAQFARPRHDVHPETPFDGRLNPKLRDKLLIHSRLFSRHQDSLHLSVCGVASSAATRSAELPHCTGHSIDAIATPRNTGDSTGPTTLQTIACPTLSTLGVHADIPQINAPPIRRSDPPSFPEPLCGP
jgi:hypothetical protein